MRLTALAWAALALSAGCVRFGYDSDPRKQSAGFDSGTTQPDGAVSDSGSAADGGMVKLGMDAAVRGDAATADAGAVPRGGSGGAGKGVDPIDAGRFDASKPDSGTTDSGKKDSGTSDSGTADSGTKDSGTTDPGTTDPVDPRWTEDCPGVPGVLFCDDFEGGLAKWTYTVQTRGSTAVTTGNANSGSNVLRASTSASTASVQSKARQGVIAFGHRKSGDLWARYFYYLPSSVTLTQKFSSGVISEYEDPWLGFSVLIFPDGVGIESGDTSRMTTTTTFPRDQWVCVEMHVHIDASAGLFEFYMNGASISSLSGLNTLPAQGYTSFELGVHYANFNQGAITVYADDVKLGTRRLGCSL